MDIFMIPITGIIAGSIAVVAIAYIYNDRINRDREMEHKERIMKLEVEKMKLQKEEGEK